MKKFKKTWILGGIFLLLLAYVYFVEIKGAEKKQALKDAKEKVLVFNKEDVESVILKNTYGTFEAKRIGEDEWMLEKPLKAKADKNVWNGLLDSIHELKSKRVIQENGDIEPYGLKHANLEVELKLSKKSKSISLRVGDENPVGDSRFVTDQDAKKVLLVGDDITYKLDKDIKQLREKKLFRFDDLKTQEITVQRKSKRIVLKKIQDKWFLVSGAEKKEAEPKKIKEILNAIKHLEVKDFEVEEPKDLEKYGLTKPAITVSFRDDKATQLELLFGKEEKDGVYLSKKAEKPVYKVNTYVLKRIPEDTSKLLKQEKPPEKPPEKPKAEEKK